jgi:cell division protein FtsB
VDVQSDANKKRGWIPAGPARYLLLAVLIALICAEAYYIYTLKQTIRQQTEDLRGISIQLQLLKNEREILNEEISSAKKHAGDDNGNAAER